MAPILTNSAVPIWLVLLVLAPAAAWAIARDDVKNRGGTARPAATRLALLGGAVVVALSAAACFDGVRAGAAALLGWALLALARIDLAAGLLPDRLTAPLALAGIGVAGIGTPESVPAALGAALLGMAAGFVSLAGVALIYRRWRGRDGMGLGDAKLLGAAGAWLGAAALPLTVCLAASSALVAVLATRRLGWRFERDGAIPFGPFLCLAAWIVFLTHGDMLR
jgi:leader peptidase (prepilin peptidase) / N-methyltransferase